MASSQALPSPIHRQSGYPSFHSLHPSKLSSTNSHIDDIASLMDPNQNQSITQQQNCSNVDTKSSVFPYLIVVILIISICLFLIMIPLIRSAITKRKRVNQIKGEIARKMAPHIYPSGANTQLDECTGTFSKTQLTDLQELNIDIEPRAGDDIRKWHHLNEANKINSRQTACDV